MVLQIVAWGLMVENNMATTDSIQDAITITFTPEEHCRICESIDNAQEAEKEFSSPALGYDVFVWFPSFSNYQIQTDSKHLYFGISSCLSAQWITDTIAPPPRSVV